MNPFDYYKTLSKDQRRAYAEQAGTTLNYLAVHVFRSGGQIRRPSNGLLIGLVNASDGQVSLDEAINYFLVQPVYKQLNDMGLHSLIQKGGTAPAVTPIETANVQDKKSYPQPKPELPSFGAGRV